MNRVAFYTLGCKVNQYETEAMQELFEKRGYQIVECDEFADIYVINTCTVTNLGDRKSRQFIRRAKKLNRDSIVAVVGCYSQVAPDEVKKMKEVDVILGTTHRDKIVDLCEKAILEDKKINMVKDVNEHKEFENLNIADVKSKTRAYIKIQDGCNQFCSYCIIPYARGPIRSRNLQSIIDEAQRLSEAGFKEVILTGIHVASYGKDLNSISLVDVIEEVAKVDGIERIRLSSIEPTLIDDQFMRRVIKTNKLCDHFHLSLQSGSDEVLNRMNRKYTTQQYKEIVKLIREYMPNVGITTDIIVGFPGETDREFQQTYDFVKEIGFSRIHVFKYSPRKGTPASKFKKQIHGEIKQQRSDMLIALGDKLMKDFNKKFLGHTLEVLFEENSKDNADYMEGYTTNYIRVKAKADDSIKGKILPVKIICEKDDILIGKIEEL
ncbi:threonylcarbamoyladenosine tRNA methylthiotransferase MtaB [Keratinibaculum paraultunense]|uniref:Threonylcarbamoyladenosine tRNA methylthiotransferase MtaB n=1 Tax=Keratinibaculum paraultunense TaxID=1278232 RepID=A0A4R3L3I1_9FIRM|nr:MULTISPECIES: tRNA (N(6)-L-threonylcarbamoyladenosine(37)-C(2))-methylthiotransferase MtaB [Bacillota]MBU5455495.1 tRNA (N(6)-L-threonylcarbamoyladenosine(37)-C(2))-methylthiotransferase MtaB [Caproiciproducens sp. MSJ-32]QQY80465.1 tRNA (N(6)-L-threonylcarbamoyladenosine(37)-C(2))-methylthiotransferase MtaB [Keratinibaculum paraultunense]TCS91183.1 threonylcarbamoyladenosine tRNA methylthiotransferase MtaB [Keratinibaculum paraultunense]